MAFQGGGGREDPRVERKEEENARRIAAAVGPGASPCLAGISPPDTSPDSRLAPPRINRVGLIRDTTPFPPVFCADLGTRDGENGEKSVRFVCCRSPVRHSPSRETAGVFFFFAEPSLLNTFPSSDCFLPEAGSRCALGILPSRPTGTISFFRFNEVLPDTLGRRAFPTRLYTPSNNYSVFDSQRAGDRAVECSPTNVHQRLFANEDGARGQGEGEGEKEGSISIV